jgi:hypothetical protein
VNLNVIEFAADTDVVHRKAQQPGSSNKRERATAIYCKGPDSIYDWTKLSDYSIGCCIGHDQVIAESRSHEDVTTVTANTILSELEFSRAI